MSKKINYNNIHHDSPIIEIQEEEASGTLNIVEDEEKSGTLSEGDSGTHGFGEDEALSAAINRCGEVDILYGFDKDGNHLDSADGDYGFSSGSDISLYGDIDAKKICTLEGTPTIFQTLQRIEVGQMYATKSELQRKLRMITIFQNFDYTTYKSTKTLLVLKCFVVGCSWKMRASMVTSSSKFKVRKYIDTHTCPVTSRCSRHRQATSKCIGELYLEKFGKVGVGIRPAHIIDVMKAMYGIDIDYWKSYKALVHARELERGTWESGYEDLPLYLHKLEVANPNTITKLECDQQDRFKYLFIAFGACINGFKFIRNVIVVDGAHLKGKFKGVLLVAASQDGNGEIFPLAFGIVDSENHGSWEWFLTQLRGVCVAEQGLVIIYDRHRSIGKSVRKVFPFAYQGICTYHLYQNLITRFKESSTLTLVKKAAKVYRTSEFIALFEEIRRQNPNLAKYLEKVDVRLWARANFQGDRYDIMTSNIAESMNKVLRNAREYPIAYFLGELRKVISKWFARRRTSAMSLQTLFTPRVETTLAYRWKIGSTLTVQRIDTYRYHVTGGAFACVVDIQQMSCTCRVYDVDKIPCEHALAVAIKQSSISLETLVHPYYTKNNLYYAYAESINPEDVEWEPRGDFVYKRCLPPLLKRGVGRPKKSRYLSALEKAMNKQPKVKTMKVGEVSTTQQTQSLRKMYACSQCKKSGHNRTLLEDCHIQK